MLYVILSTLRKIDLNGESAEFSVPLKPQQGQSYQVPPHQLPQHIMTGASSRIVLPETKLSCPRLPDKVVVRERLLRELDTSLEHRLTLLSASAGWGKTTLLTTWVGRLGKGPNKVAWVSLDTLDNDNTRFWVAVIRALRSCMSFVPPVPAVTPDGAFGSVPLAMLNSPQPAPFATTLTMLLNELSAALGHTDPAEASSTVLILDDYHLINDPAIHDALTFFIEHLPDYIHMVVATRVDPDLPLSRWRVRGQMVEIRAADLRFSALETTSFFTQAIGYALPERDIELLEKRTEGWAVGLQFAALAMQKREDLSAFVQTFSGGHRFLLDYIQDEILDRQPLSVQRFLLWTSVLPRMNAEVCAAIMDEPASFEVNKAQEMLEWLERNNLLVVPLDEQRQWYRIHDLFREMLLVRLHATQPKIVSRLHRRAARWWEGQGNWREAITHAMHATDFSYAASLMERAAETMWLTGEVKTLYRWVMALPEEVVERHARMVLTAALYLLNSSASTAEAEQIRARDEAERLILRVEAALLREPNGTTGDPEVEGARGLRTDEEALLRQRISMLRLWVVSFDATTKGDIAQLRGVCQQMQEAGLPDELVWQMIPLAETVILRAAFEREGATLVPLLLDAKRRATLSGNRYATLKVIQWLAMCELQAGQLRQAHQESLSALDLIQQNEGHALLAGYFYLFLADVLYEWNKLGEAAVTVQKMIHDAGVWQQVDLQVSGYGQLALSGIASRDLIGAERALLKMEEMVQNQQLAHYQSTVESVRAQLWVAQGNLAAASQWASRFVFDPCAWIPRYNWELLMSVRVYLAQHRYTQAREALERFSTYLDQPGDIYTAIQFMALHVAALHGEGRREQSAEVLARLLPMTEPDGYIRVYLDAGQPMREALEHHLSSQNAKENGLPRSLLSYASKLLAAFERDMNIAPQPSSVRTTPQLISQPPAARTLAIEPLTQREEEVLRLLMAGSSNQEIATQLVISLATVKKHVSNILGKLGVESRVQAIARSRELSLLL